MAIAIPDQHRYLAVSASPSPSKACVTIAIGYLGFAHAKAIGIVRFAPAAAHRLYTSRKIHYWPKGSAAQTRNRGSATNSRRRGERR